MNKEYANNISTLTLFLVCVYTFNGVIHVHTHNYC